MGKYQTSFRFNVSKTILDRCVVFLKTMRFGKPDINEINSRVFFSLDCLVAGIFLKRDIMELVDFSSCVTVICRCISEAEHVAFQTDFVETV